MNIDGPNADFIPRLEEIYDNPEETYGDYNDYPSAGESPVYYADQGN